MNNIAFVDTECTGLTPDRHSIWEVALITPGGEHVWQFAVEEMKADPFALEIGHYWERRWGSENEIDYWDAVYKAHTFASRRKSFLEQGKVVVPNADWAKHFRELTAGLHLAGAVVSFDEERLRKLLRTNGVLPRWHYHLITVEALAAGWLAARKASREHDNGYRTPDGEWVVVTPTPPWTSGELSRAVGVEPPGPDERHTALGDARWAKRIYEAVMGD